MLDSLWNSYLKSLSKVSEPTLKSYNNAFVIFKDFLNINNFNIDNIENNELQKFIEYLTEVKKYKNSTANKQITIINNCLKYNNINKRISYIKDITVKSGNQELTQNDFERLLRYADADETTILKFIYLTGVRVSELNQIKVSDIKNKSFDVTNKGKTRTVNLNKECIKMLREYTKQHNLKADDVIFPFYRQKVNEIMHSLSGKSKVKKSKCTPHNLRRLTAKTLESNGVKLTIIQQVLGHENIETTIKYLRLTTKEVVGALDLL